MRETPKHPAGRAARVGLLALCALLSPGLRAAAAAAPAGGSPAQQEEAILSQLKATLTWYHQVQASDEWVVQPGDEIYRATQHGLTGQVVSNAFAYARAMAVVIGDEQAPLGKKPDDARSQRLSTLEAANTKSLADLDAQLKDLDARIAAAPAGTQPALAAQREVLQAQVDLDQALSDSLAKATALASDDGAGAGSFASRVAALQRAAPTAAAPAGTEAAAAKDVPKAEPARSSPGLLDRAATLFSLVRYRRSMDVLQRRTEELLAASNSLADPLAAQLRAAMQQGEQAGQGTAQETDPARLAEARDKILAVTARFKALSAALMPLRAESRALEQTRMNLGDWQRSLVSENDSIIRTFLGRAVALAVALAVLVAFSEVWRRATFRYVHDARRRRQFLLIRRFATAILMVVVIVMGFVSDFSSIATFAGFITAGIAVALQTVILSVAAYFFLIGRYGVRVGDRVTVSGVTGDVIDIGLVRVFLMELAGTGIDLHPTGRVVVLANSALFSATPLYKQLPGTDYAWHEVFVGMAGDADTSRAEAALLKAVNGVYGTYRSAIERQHGVLERLLDYKTDVPEPSGHVRLSDTGLEVVIRYPAEIRRMSEVDERVTKEVMAAVRGDEELRKSLSSMPRIRAAVKS